MNKFLNRWSRKLHRWGAIICAAPLLLVVITGLLLQVKKQVPWVQPATAKGSGKEPSVSMAEVLSAAKSVPEAEIAGWGDIDRLDVRPGKGVIKIRSNNRWEIQIDAASAEILQVKFRRSDFIESLHDGSWFHDGAKLWVFFPNGLILLALWITGIYLWLLPWLTRRRNRRRRAAAESP